MKSMTGYANVSKVIDGYEIKVETRSLNSKYLNVNISLPSFLNSCEIQLSDIVSKWIKRGKVSVKIFVNFVKPVSAIKVNLGLSKAYYEALESIVSYLGIPEPVKLDNLLRFKEIVFFDMDDEEVNKICTYVKDILNEVMRKVTEEREREGEKLKNYLKGFLEKMREKVKAIESHSEDMLKYYAERLRKNIEKILPSDIVFEKDLFEASLAVLADRADIQEELDRLKSHISRAEEFLESEEPVGANLDFLAQELLREFNTILSKSKLSSITNVALEGKLLVNSFREQVQNVE